MQRIEPQISSNEKDRRSGAVRAKWSLLERALRSERARQLHLDSNDSKLPWLVFLLQLKTPQPQHSADPTQTSH
ncbi:MAG: hypothetical protein CMJ75_19500 [Planctomycetaceae bacterium]|nr:hypothetical protein [Planctomycetaceae bacterium]